MDKLNLLDEFLFFGEEVVVVGIVEEMKFCEVIVKNGKRKLYVGFEELQPLIKVSFIKRFFGW